MLSHLLSVLARDRYPRLELERPQEPIGAILAEKSQFTIAHRPVVIRQTLESEKRKYCNELRCFSGRNVSLDSSATTRGPLRSRAARSNDRAAEAKLDPRLFAELNEVRWRDRSNVAKPITHVTFLLNFFHERRRRVPVNN